MRSFMLMSFNLELFATTAVDDGSSNNMDMVGVKTNDKMLQK